MARMDTHTSSRPRRTLRIVVAIVALAAAVAAGFGIAQWKMAHEMAATAEAPAHSPSPSPSSDRKVLYWYDPMVPQQRFDKPGKSPFMDMMLVPKYADEEAASAPGVKVDPRLAQSLGMRTAEVRREALGGGLVALATVGFDERQVAVLQARTAGFVERVRPLAPGDVVARGAVLAEVLVPEWAGAQQEYLAVRAGGDAALSAAARQRLRLLGMPDALVAEVERSGRPQALQPIVAPIAGVLQALDIRQGMALSPGMTLARINGIATMWLEAAVPEAQAAALPAGRAVEATLPAYPGEVFRGQVVAVLPEISRESRTLRVRMAFANTRQRLKAGMTAQVRLPGSSESVLLVPAEAVVRTGQRAVVYVVDSEPGRYRPVTVELGREVGDKLEVRKGLSEGERVVTSGQFLIDSEASLSGVLPRGDAASAPAR
jgi:Cu(I)/Ag(I) efflux system membrane fusion protein